MPESILDNKRILAVDDEPDVLDTLEELLEDPLRPPVVTGVGRIDLAVPVIRKAEGLELLAEPLNVLLGRDLGMRAGFNRILLGR